MRAVLVSINFSPEVTGIGPVTRAYADLLHEAGHEVIVVTGYPHYPEWRSRPADDADIPYRVERCRHYVPSRTSFRHLALYELSFAYAVARRLGVLPRADVVVALIPTLAAAAVAAAWAALTGARCVAITQDIVSVGAGETGVAGPISSTILRLLEKNTLRMTTAVGVINDAMVGALTRLGVPRSRIHIVPNWPLYETVPFPRNDAARIEIGFREREIVAVHAGNMGAKQGLEVVVGAGYLAAERNLSVRFLLIGDGKQRPALEESSRGLRTLEFWPLQSQEVFHRALAGADVLLLTQRASVKDFAFPSKLTSYTRAGRPIVASVAVDSAVGRALSRAGAALLVAPDDPAALLEGVLEVARNPVLGQRLATAADRYYRDELDAAKLRAEFRGFVEATERSAR